MSRRFSLTGTTSPRIVAMCALFKRRTLIQNKLICFCYLTWWNFPKTKLTNIWYGTVTYLSVRNSSTHWWNFSSTCNEEVSGFTIHAFNMANLQGLFCGLSSQMLTFNFGQQSLPPNLSESEQSVSLAVSAGLFAPCTA